MVLAPTTDVRLMASRKTNSVMTMSAMMPNWMLRERVATCFSPQLGVLAVLQVLREQLILQLAPVLQGRERVAPSVRELRVHQRAIGHAIRSKGIRQGRGGSDHEGWLPHFVGGRESLVRPGKRLRSATLADEQLRVPGRTIDQRIRRSG